MSISGHDFPDEPPTPQPWEDDELSVRQALRALGTHVLAEIANLRGSLELELRGIHASLNKLEDRSEDTGRHIIHLAEATGEAKGIAESSRRRDSDPVRSLVVNVFTIAAKHAPRWLWPLISAGVMLALHKLGWLGK